MAVLVVMMSMTISNMNVVFPTYAEVVGLGAIVGGFMVTAASLADIALNPILGTTADKFGPTKSFIGWTVVTMVSFVILYFSVNSPILAIVGAGINDVMYALCGVGLAPFTMAWFGKKDYERIFSTVMMFGYLVASLGVPIMMKIYEVTGAFENVFVFGFIVCAIIIVCLLVGEKQSAKLPQETVEVAAEAAPQE